MRTSPSWAHRLSPASALEPNGSWDALGFFSDDALRMLDFAGTEVSPVPYAFGDDLDTPPVITAPGTQVTDFGVVYTQAPPDWRPPTSGVNGQVAFAQSSTPIVAGDELMLIWTEYDSDLDFSSGLTLNEGVTLAIPGLPVWNSTFEGDTWEGTVDLPRLSEGASGKDTSPRIEGQDEHHGDGAGGRGHRCRGADVRLPRGPDHREHEPTQVPVL